ncbi:hypothetical protein OC834_005652 [Tilletia horrida]|nr:hypothetical protein OC834_005652 [Tilletia horrida]
MSPERNRPRARLCLACAGAGRDFVVPAHLNMLDSLVEGWLGHQVRVCPALEVCRFLISGEVEIDVVPSSKRDIGPRRHRQPQQRAYQGLVALPVWVLLALPHWQLGRERRVDLARPLEVKLLHE